VKKIPAGINLKHQRNGKASYKLKRGKRGPTATKGKPLKKSSRVKWRPDRGGETKRTFLKQTSQKCNVGNGALWYQT